MRVLSIGTGLGDVVTIDNMRLSIQGKSSEHGPDTVNMIEKDKDEKVLGAGDDTLKERDTVPDLELEEEDGIWATFNSWKKNTKMNAPPLPAPTETESTTPTELATDVSKPDF